EPWNGRHGGIVAIEATDTVTLAALVDVSSIGFVGGAPSRTSNSCQSSGRMNVPWPSAFAGQKGEGAAHRPNERAAGIARLASGGGGGANHNAGGGGGGNGGQGGQGGAVYSVCPLEKNGGLGGAVCIQHDPQNPRLFFGGGGGGGHQNE